MATNKSDGTNEMVIHTVSLASLEAEGQGVFPFRRDISYEAEDCSSAAEPYGKTCGDFKEPFAAPSSWRDTGFGLWLRVVVSKLADLFPNHVFFGKGFLPSLNFVAADENHTSDGNTALIATAIAASRSLEPGASFAATFTTLRHRGQDIGDFVITVERKR